MTGEQKKQKKEMLVELMSNDLYVPMKIKELAILLQVPKERRQELQEVLDELMLEVGNVASSRSIIVLFS